MIGRFFPFFFNLMKIREKCRGVVTTISLIISLFNQIGMNTLRSAIVFCEMVTEDGGSSVSSGIDLNDGMYPFVIIFVVTSSFKDSHCSLFFKGIISNLPFPSPLVSCCFCFSCEKHFHLGFAKLFVDLNHMYFWSGYPNLQYS